MRWLSIICFLTAAVAVSTAENATGEKFWMCIAAGCAGIVLMSLANILANILDDDENKY